MIFLSGLLMMHKVCPADALDYVPEWVLQKRKERVSLSPNAFVIKDFEA